MQGEVTIRPVDEAELCDVVAQAVSGSGRLRIRGGGSKDDVGAPTPEATVLDMTGFTGIVNYDPPELVLTARAGTPLAEVEALLKEHGQMLAFAPWETARVFSNGTSGSTIGGTVAAGISGSQRLTQGAARDHLLGFAAVSGRGESFVGGAKVVKNVTGYDLPKLLAGSWGRLAVLTELTLKVLPRPAASLTVVARGLTPRQAWAAMAHFLQSNAEVAAAAHLPAGMLDGRSVTALRVQGFSPSVEARCQMIEASRTADSRFARCDERAAAEIWDMLRELTPLIADRDRPLWRVSLPPRHAADFIDVVRADDKEWLMDWAGGLVWYAGDCLEDVVRPAAAGLGGHAALVRGPLALRAAIPAFHPADPAVVALEGRVRRAFDPAGVFATDRF